MAKIEKLIARLLLRPADFTWDELLKVLAHFGFEELKNGKTGGSRRKFANDKKQIIAFHKPHPGNIVKRYVIDQVIAVLKENEHLKDE